jgi:hypothetical protein
MSRRERVASTPFGQFMASTGGRITRGVIGIALIVAGVLVGGVAGWALGAFGAILVAAGLFDFCVITGLIDKHLVWARSASTRSPRSPANRLATWWAGQGGET